MSPASGDLNKIAERDELKTSFHSINVPSEWGLIATINEEIESESFHSINVPSEWGPDSGYSAYDIDGKFPFN